MTLPSFSKIQLITTILLFNCGSNTASWWYLSKYENSVRNTKILCSIVPTLHPNQRRMCRRNAEVVHTIAVGTKEAIAECQFQFRFYKWNCSTFERDSSVFGKNFIKGGSPELAFVQALTTASAVLSVSRACSSGLVSCGCALRTLEEGEFNRSDFKWGGCIESTRFALNFVRRFGNAEEKGHRDPKARMTIFNNKAGREGILKHSATRCKCHGVSGSCTMRSCWRFLPNLRALGNYMKEKYDGAIKVDFDPRGKMITVDNLQKKPTKSSLIYFEDSPDGCVLDYSRGLLGTSERICNASSDGPDSCDILCCAQAHTTQRVSVTFRCNCVFKWCCNVTCKQCQEWKAISRCERDVDGESPTEHYVAPVNNVPRMRSWREWTPARSSTLENINAPPEFGQKKGITYGD